jgi:ribosomal protein S18 acetylase RimI-like enzyme
MKIRPANEKDILQVSLLWLKMVRELTPHTKPNVEWWKSRQGYLMCMENYAMHVAEDEDGKLVGFIDHMVCPEPSNSKILGIGQTLYVLPQYRNSYIAGRLWKMMLKHFKEKKVQEIEIICADEQKPFWKKRGFRFKYNYMNRGD